MTQNERTTIYESVDILRALGGNNGFSNLQPKMKRILLDYANKLNDIADRDVKKEKTSVVEAFEGVTVNG